MSDLDGGIAQFLIDCMNEDERDARLAAEAGRCADPRWTWTVEPFVPSSEGAVPANAWVVDEHEIGVAVVNGSYAADHIARHDPARALREVAMKRKLLESHGLSERLEYGDPLCWGCTDLWPCDTALSVAAIYAERPGYKPEWKLTSG